MGCPWASSARCAATASLPRRRQWPCSGRHPRSTTSDSAPISTWPRARIRLPVPEDRVHRRGLLDTSVVIDLGTLDPWQLPQEVAVSAITMAELAAGPHATSDPEERGR